MTQQAEVKDWSYCQRDIEGESICSVQCEHCKEYYKPLEKTLTTMAGKKKGSIPHENKFHVGNPDGKHYWLTPPNLMRELQLKFDFDFDPCPFPKPDDFDGLTIEWGKSNYVNPPFGSVIHQGKKKGMTAWVRKAIEEHKKGKRVVMVYPVDKWVLMLVKAGAKISNLGDIKWVATEDGSEGKGTGRHIAMFVLEPMPREQKAEVSDTTMPL